MSAAPPITAAPEAICAAMLGRHWRRSAARHAVESAAMHARAAHGLALALRRLAAASHPGERFTLQSWADQLTAAYPPPPPKDAR